jgi:hypothetical protein
LRLTRGGSPAVLGVRLTDADHASLSEPLRVGATAGERHDAVLLAILERRHARAHVALAWAMSRAGAPSVCGLWPASLRSLLKLAAAADPSVA